MSIPPIIINDMGDIQLYPTLFEAEISLEPWQLSNKGISAYDSQGLVLIPEGSDGIHVRLHDSSPPEHRPEELKQILRDLLSGLVRDFGEDRLQIKDNEIQRLTLPELIEKVRGFSKQDRRKSFWFWKRK